MNQSVLGLGRLQVDLLQGFPGLETLLDGYEEVMEYFRQLLVSREWPDWTAKTLDVVDMESCLIGSPCSGQSWGWVYEEIDQNAIAEVEETFDHSILDRGC